MPKGENDEPRPYKTSEGNFTGDVVREYWDGKLIRDHSFTVTMSLGDDR